MPGFPGWSRYCSKSQRIRGFVVSWRCAAPRLDCTIPPKVWDRLWDRTGHLTAECPVLPATFEDLYSRRMFGFAASNEYPTAELAKDDTAAATRGGVEGAISHSQSLLATHQRHSPKPAGGLGIAWSTTRTGNALDDAPAESFLSTLQHELINRRAWRTEARARQEIALWVHGCCNLRCLHSAIAMTSPIGRTPFFSHQADQTKGVTPTMPRRCSLVCLAGCPVHYGRT